jgi:hypothetical protein
VLAHDADHLVQQPGRRHQAAAQVERRSMTSASATTEHRIRGQIGQPAACMMENKVPAFLLALHWGAEKMSKKILNRFRHLPGSGKASWARPRSGDEGLRGGIRALHLAIGRSCLSLRHPGFHACRGVWPRCCWPPAMRWQRALAR